MSERLSTSVRGHRLLPHTADVIIEAWAPDRAQCLAEATRALVGAFADTPETPVATSTPVAFTARSDPELLVQVLDEVIFLAEVLGRVVVSAELENTDDGGVAGFFEVVDVEQVVPVGAVPKGVSRSGLELCPGEGGWYARAVIDV